ncbi:MAG: ferredoxin [Actinobacteria bacterium]|uniref:Unannotated protein n=1 Tax=freshwater metagenome TaxID=449393 RepID=A0A6J7KE19_9ZZZZ|nr:ferredoxin [Actinomycetota bacterium]
MKITIEGDACICSGSCVLECPEVFGQDPVEGTVVVLNDTPSNDLLDRVLAAENNCPAQVIIVIVE